MAQAEDAELRDLVIEALEKNGSLAKIRALLRANIFLAFEDENGNSKNKDTLTLDKVLQQPEGKFCLSLVHEFLEFCNLRNTLFVYKSETRQGREYNCDNVNNIADQLNISKLDREKEPILLTLLKSSLKQGSKVSVTQSDKHSSSHYQGRRKNNYRDENSTYIVNEESSTNTSHTQSDNSSDEKNKLDLQLTLDNSDTDTSSDSTRGQTSSEYIPNKHIEVMSNKTNNNPNKSEQPHQSQELQTNFNHVTKSNNISDNCLQNIKLTNNSSTESTSYVELKPFNIVDTVLLNTPGLPLDEKHDSKQLSPHNSNSTASKVESLSPNHTLNSVSASKQDSISHQGCQANLKNSSGKSTLYDNDATEYSYDFTSPPVSGRKDKRSPRSGQQNTANKSNNTSIESNQQKSPSSQSSISLSDVADLISDRSSKKHSNVSEHRIASEKLNRSPGRDHLKILSDDSGDFSVSPIPSLSNLSLDIHSD